MKWRLKAPAVSVAHALRYVVALIACSPCILCAQAEEPAGMPTGESVLLHPSTITITGHLETPTYSTTLELAIRSIGEQIEQQRAADAAGQSPIEPLWKAAFWKYLPKGGGTMNSPMLDSRDDDPFFTPAYLQLSGRVLDRETAASEKHAQLLFGR